MVGLKAVGSEFLVNVVTQGGQDDPDIVRLNNGNFAVVWGAAGGVAVRSRIYDPSGTPVTSEFVTQGTVFSISSQVSAAATNSGGYVTFAWRGTVTGFNVEGSALDANGNRLQDLDGPSGLTATGFFPTFPEVASLNSGDIVVTYTQANDVLASFVPLDGSPESAPISINSVTSGTQRNSEISRLASGGFVVVWEDNSGVGGDAAGFGLKARTFDATGAPTSAEILVNTETAGDQLNAVVTALADGFVVVWEDPSGAGGDASGTSIKAQIFDASGTKAGGEILVNTTTANDQVTPAVVQLPSGGFVITWADASAAAGDTSGSAIRAQRFDGAGVKVGAEILVNTTTAGAQTAPAISLAGDEVIVVSWVDASASGGDTSSTAIRALRLRVDRSDVQTGTPDDDIFFVDDQDDVIIELPGNGNDTAEANTSYALAAGVSVENLRTTDPTLIAPIDLTGNEIANAVTGNAAGNRLDGGGGDDRLFGLGGDDTLLGGEGADQLDGGTGVDRMEGGNGDDFYVTDNASDLVIEADGAGTDFVTASVSYTLGSGQRVEYLSVAGWATTFAINLTGNEFANTLYGNAGVNQLDGGGGADTLVGFGGDDYYIVDNAGDDVVEGAGGGSDFVAASTTYTLGAAARVEYLSVAGWGTTGAIDLTGNAFANTIYGNAGVNVLDGKGGNDVMVGFAGADRFAFTTALGGSNVDAVADFEAGIDKIALDDAVFTGLGLGALPAGAFRTGATAQDADDRILYDPATGALYFDADGAGGAAAVQFASLSTGLGLGAGDFVVI